MGQQLLPPSGWVSHFSSGCQTFMSQVLVGFSQWKTMGTAPVLEAWHPTPLQPLLRAFPRWPRAEGWPDNSDSSRDFGFTLWETCTDSRGGGKGMWGVLSLQKEILQAWKKELNFDIFGKQYCPTLFNPVYLLKHCQCNKNIRKGKKSCREGWEATSGCHGRICCQISRCICTCFWLSWSRTRHPSLQVTGSTAVDAATCCAGSPWSQQAEEALLGDDSPRAKADI